MYFEKNLNVIKIKNISLYEQILASQETDASEQMIRLETEPGFDGDSVLYMEWGDANYRLNSMYSPKFEAQRWIEQFELKGIVNVVFMFGLGNGYFVREMLKKLSDKDKIFVYEPNKEIFIHVMHNYNLTDILNDNHLFIAVSGINEQNFSGILRSNLSLVYLNAHILCSHPQYCTIFEQQYAQYIEELQGVVDTISLNAATYRDMSYLVLENIVNNIPLLTQGIQIRDFQRVYQFTKPVVIVAAGPSVKESIEELKKIRDQVMIIAVERIINYLMEFEVEPDFIVTLDSAKDITKIHRLKDSHVPLFCNMQSSFKVLEMHTGKKICCMMDPFTTRVVKSIKDCKLEYIVPAQSVSCFAFQIAMYMGAKDIILVGQDLASSGNVTHAGGVSSNPFSGEVIQVEGIDGGIVDSRYDWIEYLKWYHEMIKLHPEITVYDVKSHGAKIDGTVNISLKEAVKCSHIKVEKETKKADDVLSEIPSLLNEEEIKCVYEAIHVAYQELDFIYKKAKEGICLCCDTIELIKQHKSGTSSFNVKIAKMKKINEHIREKSVYLLLNSLYEYGMKDNIGDAYIKTGDTITDNLNAVKLENVFFEYSLTAVKFAKKTFNNNLDIEVIGKW